MIISARRLASEVMATCRQNSNSNTLRETVGIEFWNQVALGNLAQQGGFVPGLQSNLETSLVPSNSLHPSSIAVPISHHNIHHA